MPLVALLALLGVGGAGIYLGKKWEESNQKELAFKNQAECFELARQGKVNPELCTKIGKDKGTLAALADVAEETGKAILAAAVAYGVAHALGGRR